MKVPFEALDDALRAKVKALFANKPVSYEVGEYNAQSFVPTTMMIDPIFGRQLPSAKRIYGKKVNVLEVWNGKQVAKQQVYLTQAPGDPYPRVHDYQNISSRSWGEPGRNDKKIRVKLKDRPPIIKREGGYYQRKPIK